MSKYQTMSKYQPFAYPPDFGMARVHQNASMPGKLDHSSKVLCPCCQRPQRLPFQSWFNRSIDHDFKTYGGAVVTYFWLVKMYAIICALIVVIYSSYLIYCIHHYCSEGICERFLGLWIVSNEDLHKIIHERGAAGVVTRLFTLRGIAFIIMLLGNMVTLYVVGRFKRRYPQGKGIADFAVLFKNVKVSSSEEAAIKLKEEFPQIEIKQIFFIKKMEPFYTLYNTKLSLYYSSLVETNQKKRQKLILKLDEVERKCGQEEARFEEDGDRVIVLLDSEYYRKCVLDRFCLKRARWLKHLLGFSEAKVMYCEECPTPEEIIWNNIGKEEKQTIKLKILSVTYFALLLAGSYLVLFVCMRIVYTDRIKPDILKDVLTQLILIFLVVIALSFRQWMNKLSEMRRPNTQTNRTMFIVLTTVLFHFIYYLIIPTIYFYFAGEQRKNKTLKIIANQTLNFLIVQFILAGVDLMHCCWNKRLKRVENEGQPIGCQKMLHEQMQYPRFPIEFKLIILFKVFSFIIFFAFQVPSILMLIAWLLIFLYIKDKHSLYYHYRMEIIDSGVQFQFLKIYSNFFSIYMYAIFVMTQHLDIEKYVGFSITCAAIIIQTFFIKEQKLIDDSTLPMSLDELSITDSYRSYRARYLAFRGDVVDDRTDLIIKEYLAKHGYGSIQTEDSLHKNFV